MSKKVSNNDKENITRAVYENTPDGKQVSIHIRDHNKIKLPPNVMVFQAFAYLAAIKLKPATNRVLMLFFAKSAYENFLGIDILTIAEELEMTDRSILSAIKELCENNIIIKIKHPIDKRRNDYFLNPTAAWKGNSYTRAKSISKINKNQLDLFNENQIKSLNKSKSLNNNLDFDNEKP